MRVENEMSEFTQIRRGVRQGCVFSPYLFNMYSELFLRELDGMQEFIIGGHNMNNLRYADDTVLISESAEKLQELLDRVVAESRKKGLTINCKKTECMVVSKQLEKPQFTLQIGENIIQQVGRFNYLGSVITDDGKCDSEIKRRKGMAKDAFQKLGKILKDRKMSMDTKFGVLDCYSRKGKKLDEINQKETVGVFWAHNEKRNLENLTLTGRIEGKRSRGRQRLTYLGSLSKWMAAELPERERAKVSEQELMRRTRDRKLWRTMIANVLAGHGT
eukprot:gene9669-biopygen2063